MKPAALLATLFLTVVALAHLARVGAGVPIQVGFFGVPPWMSGVAFLFCSALALALIREGRRG
jgi:membrane protein implicated in regulation of membrane protease activity